MNFIKMKKILLIVFLLTITVMLSNNFNSQAQEVAGPSGSNPLLSPVLTSCMAYDSLRGFSVVGYANNCKFGRQGCVDNTCPGGLIEFQP